jgi:hypothetical protein
VDVLDGIGIRRGGSLDGMGIRMEGCIEGVFV